MPPLHHTPLVKHGGNFALWLLYSWAEAAQRVAEVGNGLSSGVLRKFLELWMGFLESYIRGSEPEKSWLDWWV